MKPRTTCLLISLVATAIIAVPGIAAALRAPARLQPDLRGTAQQPLIVKSVPNAEEMRRNAEYQADRAANLTAMRQATEERKKNDRTAEWISAFTLAILIVQAAAFIYQAIEMRSSVVAMKEATDVAKRSADLAKTAADAAVNANDLNPIALALDQRPWMGIMTESHEAHLTVTKYTQGPHFQAIVDLPVHNTGKTPAHDVRLIAQLISDPQHSNIEKAHLAFCNGSTPPQLMSTTSTAEIFFPRESRRIAGYVNIPAGLFSAIRFRLCSTCLAVFPIGFRRKTLII